MKIILGCEESQTVCIEMRKRGHEAYSCDILPCSGGHSEWHLQMDVFDAIKLKKWDMGIFFPMCTYLTVTGNKWMKPEYEKRFPDRKKQREDAVEFFMKLYNSDIDKIAIENPIGIMSTRFRKPNQIIHPYYFGDPERKSTCLWLKGLPKLKHTKIVEPEYYICKKGWRHSKFTANWDAKKKSVTFAGIATAMANQWGTDVENDDSQSVPTNELILTKKEKDLIKIIK